MKLLTKTQRSGPTPVSRTIPSFVAAARTWPVAILSLVILGLGLFAAVSTALLVYRTYSPVPYFDQWNIVDSMMHLGQTPVLSMIWAQHNEHRIPVGRITGYADMFWFGGRNISLLIEIYLIQLASALVSIWMFRRFGPPRWPVQLTAAGLFTFCMLCPIQLGNFIWGFQTTFVFTGLATAVAFAGLVCHSVEVAEDKTRWISAPLVVSWSWAFLAECGRADGLFVWPILILFAYFLGFPRRTQILTASLGVIGVGLYLYGYQTPAQHAKPWISIQHPILMAKFVITYFASSWDASLPPSSSWPTISQSITVLALAGALGSAVWFFYLRSSATDPLRTFLLANLLFTILSAVLTSLGRLNFGIEQAMSSHYQAIALSFWASLGALIMASLGGDQFRDLALVQIGLAVRLLATPGRFNALEQASKQHQMDLARAYTALAFNPTDQEALKILNPDVNGLHVWYAYLRSHNLGPDPHEFVIPPSHPLKILAEPIPNWAGYHIVATNKCLGFLDAVRPISPGAGTVVAGGWAWDVAAARPASKIVLALPDGLVVGFGDVDAPRPDVRVARKEVTELNSGWNAEAVVPHGSVLRAFAVLSDLKSICPLANEIGAP